MVLTRAKSTRCVTLKHHIEPILIIWARSRSKVSQYLDDEAEEEEEEEEEEEAEEEEENIEVVADNHEGDRISESNNEDARSFE